MINTSSISCGGQVATYQDLTNVPLPEKTETYEPVSHAGLADMIRGASEELLRATCVQESYALTRKGQRMFGLQTFSNGDSSELGLSVGFRNSYDRSMSIGIAMGFRVFVCDNLAISGEVRILRKHTKKVFQDVDMVLVHTLFRKGPELQGQFMEDMERLRRSLMPRMAGYEFLGRCYGQEIVSPNQLSTASNEWEWKLKEKSRRTPGCSTTPSPTRSRPRPLSTSWSATGGCTTSWWSTPR